MSWTVGVHPAFFHLYVKVSLSINMTGAIVHVTDRQLKVVFGHCVKNCYFI